MKSIAQSNRTELKLTIKSTVKKLLIPKVLNKNLPTTNIEQTQTVLHLFPNIIMNTTIHNGSIQLVTGDLITQNVDVIVVCSTSELLLKNILEKADLIVTEEYYRLSSSVDQQISLIETSPRNLNCKAILFLPLITLLNPDSKILSNSISKFGSISLNHILYHPKVFRTVAFPAIGCGLIRCPVNIVAQAMIDTAVAKLKETILYLTIGINTKPSEPFGSVKCSFLILVGKSILGNKLMKVPSKGYDSTTDNNQIFVVYHDAQAYTNYLIKYQ
ncbi:unnamed protein product [Rotaria sordida]|uniref:Macro domain-containing protein n=1 Tax=Rotaria sordida TaxID=392033 RepID=A0A814IBV1_9BILA|nr:unnamed protein product [Rotaria sordida]CAF3609274.1 unnamed protein product [Rotaria sordida]